VFLVSYELNVYYVDEISVLSPEGATLIDITVCMYVQGWAKDWP
jgi:hypothetical protein